MYYEFYIDVFFVVNLVMDFFILQLVNRMILGAANPLRSLAGAVLGAVGSGVILFLPFSSWKIRGLISYGILAPLMVMAGCGTKNKNVFWMELLGFYGVCFAEEFFWLSQIAARGISHFGVIVSHLLDACHQYQTLKILKWKKEYSLPDSNSGRKKTNKSERSV